MGRLHANEVAIDIEQVQGLLRDQFAAWSHLPVRAVESSGTDHAIFRLGVDMGIRLPRIEGAVAQIDKEHRWLKRIAPHVGAAMPLPLGRGAPGRGYPFSWLIYRWIDGADLSQTTVGDQRAPSLTPSPLSCASCNRVDPTGAPLAGGRGADLAPYDESIRASFARVRHLIDIERATVVWRRALDAEA